MLHPDVLANIKFYSTDQNGRKFPTSSEYFGCIFVLEDKMHDCRLILEKIGSIAPGEYKNNVPIKFLCSDLVLPKLKEGSKFYLWEMRNIAEGEITKITAS